MPVFTQYTFVLFAVLHLAAGGPAAQRPPFDHFRRPGSSTTQQSSTTIVGATSAQSTAQVAASSTLSLREAVASSVQSSATGTGAIPPVAASIGTVTNATLTTTWGITRDGGGGGTVDGTHIINFSDTGADGDKFVSNSIATTSADGKTLTDYGTTYPTQQWPFESNEVAASGHRTAIWPNTNIVSGCGGACGYTLSNVIDISLTAPYASTPLYSTLANITLGSGGAPSVERLAAQMWMPGETNYGIYGLARARDGSGDVLLFAATGAAETGLKVARVEEAALADRSKYTYWDGSAWAETAPSASDTKSNIFSNAGGIGTGDIFFSQYHNRWLAVFNDGMAVDNTFQVLYSTTEELTGAWSTTPRALFVTPGCAGCVTPYNYASHAYPDIDPSGKTLLLGWTFNGAYTSFATVTWT